jgi:hypothetical protein
VTAIGRTPTRGECYCLYATAPGDGNSGMCLLLCCKDWIRLDYPYLRLITCKFMTAIAARVLGEFAATSFWTRWLVAGHDATDALALARMIAMLLLHVLGFVTQGVCAAQQRPE